jgi:5'-deoxynucleotidase YfbR-like HD superfamily hydrolase
LAELDTGDIPAPVKIHNDDMLAAVRRIEQRFNEIHGFDIWLTKEEEILVKWADMMELILWCLEEIDLGNRNLMGSVKTGFSQLDFLGTPNEAAAIMRQEAEIRFERVRR